MLNVLGITSIRFDKDSQFIVVTHRKGTMAAADSIYGVTMQESGVSKIVSVKLKDLESIEGWQLKLVATDMDGTFLDGNGRFDMDRLKSLLASYKEKGFTLRWLRAADFCL